ncbi:hypothetical protein CBS101457_000518 [Exobasidium rhododendri]|nr:hypothetical protein CBS101457_000518 [Exobasidium rhododendri]
MSSSSPMTAEGVLPLYARHAPYPVKVALLLGSIALFCACLLRFVPGLRTILVFAYNCFIQPIGKVANQGERLDKFYQNQAVVYDSTRSSLLRGRRTLLKLAAAQLRDQQKINPGKPLVWVDIGGGTGWNIEQMSEYFPLDQLSQIYLIDLCEPLLEVARQRFTARGFKNVQVLCQDAKEFHLPGLGQDQKVDLFTCSYSISMIPPFYAVLDRINDFLDPDTGIFGVVDFYVSDRSRSSGDKSAHIGGDSSRHCGWLSRFFWSHWFSFDHVELHPARRDYLEYKFGTIKCFNGRNNFIVPFIVRIPYYIWIGCSRQRDTTNAIQAFEVEAGNRVIVPPSFPELSFSHLLMTQKAQQSDEKSQMDLASSSAHSNSLSFHYQKRQWRLPYVDPEFASFRSFIYGFTWEDPYVDMQYFNIGKEDSVLCITSAGDNALHYAIAAEPRRIHCVDMNACQGHLLELKLACIASLEYDEFWSLFGEGKNERFPELLESKISPYLSSHAYQFWRLNNHYFDKAFYFRGYTGHALRLAKVAFTLARVRKHVDAFCTAETLQEQQDIWDKHLRSTMINKRMIRLFFSNPAFLWNALGVPINQYNCFRNEGITVEQYAIDTLDSMPSRALLRNENYHYKLCLQGNYSKDSSPLYLKKESYKKLKQDDAKLLDVLRLHTDSIVNVLRGLQDNSLTRAVLMDHIDWFDPGRKDDVLISALDEEIIELARVISPGGTVFWRSAAKVPWYNKNFEKFGFTVEVIHIRETGKSIDLVNFYASCWKATRM